MSTKITYPLPQWVLRLTMSTKHRDLPFFERHEAHYMGNSYFETGNPARAVKHLATKGRPDNVWIHGYSTFVIYDPERHTRDQIVQMLTDLWEGKVYLEEPIRFDKRNEYRREIQTEGYERANAWLDITNNVYWTMVECNIADVLRNMRAQVEAWDDARQARKDREARLQAQEVQQIAADSSSNSLRERMIASGQLKPR